MGWPRLSLQYQSRHRLRKSATSKRVSEGSPINPSLTHRVTQSSLLNKASCDKKVSGDKKGVRYLLRGTRPSGASHKRYPTLIYRPLLNGSLNPHAASASFPPRLARGVRCPVH